ncbi:MAG TPA: hypothetical protein VHM30_12220, partial [Gemmatimonadaceae bacterium]|nr:hypothetical protein [Gemmatimonadaceae bacterium]
MPPIDPRRVARLEEAVKALHQQVNVLISEVRTLAVQAEAEAAAGAQGAVPTPIDDSMLAPRAPMPPLAPPAPPPVPGG